ncbi:MAG: hypothetical protein H0V53_15100 [Rubrobacter sp.]|nr:hypothetical protein [Rubrobacter sp.]
MKAREELLRGLGTEFDGTVVKAFLRILDTETEGYRMADDRRFLFLEPGTEKPSEGAPQQGLQVDR